MLVLQPAGPAPAHMPLVPDLHLRACCSRGGAFAKKIPEMLLLMHQLAHLLQCCRQRQQLRCALGRCPLLSKKQLHQHLLHLQLSAMLVCYPVGQTLVKRNAMETWPAACSVQLMLLNHWLGWVAPPHAAAAAVAAAPNQRLLCMQLHVLLLLTVVV